MNTDANSVQVATSLKHTLLTTALALMLCMGTAGAVVFHDAPHTIQNVVTQIGTRAQEAAQFAKDNAQYAKEWQQIRDTYTNIKNLFDIQMFPQNFDMSERAENFGVKENCPGLDSGFSLTGTIDRMLPDDKKSIPAQQAIICAQIVTIGNRRHNELVRMLKNATQRSKEAAVVAQNAKGSRTMGDQSSNVMKAQEIANVTQADMMGASAKIEAYGAMIASLKSDQTLLARRALKGSSSAVGEIIKTGALAGALEVNKSE